MSQIFNVQRRTGALVLADGTVFPGEHFGGEPAQIQSGVLGEVVFNTAMSGYQEILTDPSYLGQIVGGSMLSDGQPLVHVRKNGSHY